MVYGDTDKATWIRHVIDTFLPIQLVTRAPTFTEVQQSGLSTHTHTHTHTNKQTQIRQIYTERTWVIWITN